MIGGIEYRTSCTDQTALATRLVGLENFLGQLKSKQIPSEFTSKLHHKKCSLFRMQSYV